MEGEEDLCCSIAAHSGVLHIPAQGDALLGFCTHKAGCVVAKGSCMLSEDICCSTWVASSSCIIQCSETHC